MREGVEAQRCADKKIRSDFLVRIFKQQSGRYIDDARFIAHEESPWMVSHTKVIVISSLLIALRILVQLDST